MALKIRRVIKGSLDTTAMDELTVTKPVAGYALAPTNKGAFMLQKLPEGWEIIGRYGPDTYKVESVIKALSQSSRRTSPV